MHDASAPERRWSSVAIGVAIAVFVALLIAVPALFLTFDEAKYLGIGRSVLAGQGPRIVFGPYFLPHSPLWSTIIAAPQSWFGIDALSWGHALNALAGAGLLALTGALGWRIRPAVGATAVIAYLAVTYLHDLTRTARLDVPAAALLLLYLLVGHGAVRRGSVRWSVAAGACFAVAFLVKEIALPLAPVPLLAGILGGRPWRSLAKVSGWMVITACVGTSWWFIFVAQVAHTVYRLGTPAWTLLPITVVLAAGSLAGITAEHLHFRRPGGTSPRPEEVAGSPSRRRPVIAWALALAWSVALTVFFARTLGSRATALVDPDQIYHYLRTWLPNLLGVVAVAVLGLPLSLAALRSAKRRGESTLAYGEAWLALVCGAPLVLLVIGIGEPPRNYLAQIGIAAVVSSAGWLWALGGVTRFVEARSHSKIARLAAFAAVRRHAFPVLLGLALVAASSILAFHALRYRQSQTGVIRSEAIQTVNAWMRDHVPPGTTVAFGSLLSYEMALGVPPGVKAVTIHQELAKVDPGAPEGIVAEGDAASGDWTSVDIAPRNVNEFQAYRAEHLATQFRETGATIWIYSTGTTTAAPTILAAIPTASGIQTLAHWAWTAGTSTVESYVLSIDPTTLTFDPARMYIAPDALDRLVTALEKTPAEARTTAATLLERLTVTGPPDQTQPLLDRLRRLAGT